jgi:hypothetical protein
MSASKRTRQKGKWLQPSEIPSPPASFRKDVFDQPCAKEAFDRVTKANLNDELVWKALWDLTCRQGETESRARNWYHPEKFSLYKLRRYPKQVRLWANEIGRVADAILSDKVYGQVARSLPAFRAEPRLAEVANLLRLHADWVEETRKVTARNAPKVPAQFHGNLLSALVDNVTRVTGEPHFGDIATLLTAAYASQGSNRIFTEPSLRMQYRRHSGQKK